MKPGSQSGTYHSTDSIEIINLLYLFHLIIDMPNKYVFKNPWLTIISVVLCKERILLTKMFPVHIKDIQNLNLLRSIANSSSFLQIGNILSRREEVCIINTLWKVPCLSSQNWPPIRDGCLLCVLPSAKQRCPPPLSPQTQLYCC